MQKRPKELAGNQLARMINESGNQIWLAGLGAFFKAQQEGGKKFEALVAEGVKAEERMKAAADERLTELRDKATGAWDGLEKAFEDRVARALHSLNVPSRDEIDTLSERVRVVTKKMSENEEARAL